MNQYQIQQAIQKLFPSAKMGPTDDYTINIDGSGNATIALWKTSLGVQPTADQLTAALATLQLQQAQSAQIALIATASTSAQTSGFTSSALGSAYTYPSGLQDQANLTAVITASLIAPSGTTFLFWCTNTASNASAFVAHTAAQIKQVGLDAMAAIMAAKQKQLTLTTEIQAATTIEAVQAIVWA